MKNTPAILLLLGSVLLLTACEDGNSDYFLNYNLPLEWNTDFHAEWHTEENVDLSLRIYPPYSNQQKTGLEADITISGRANGTDPWETVYHERLHGGPEWTHTMQFPATGTDTDMMWFRLEYSIYLRNRVEAKYSGPVIITSRPMLRPSTAGILPELRTENDFSYYWQEYLAPAVSPNGNALFIGDDLSRVFDLATGRQTRMNATPHNFTQFNAYWQSDAIVITGTDLHAVDPVSLDVTEKVQADYTFRRSDSEYVVIDRNSWLIYNPKDGTYKSQRAEFILSSDYDEVPGSITQRPGAKQYLVSHQNRFSDIWWLHGENYTPIRQLSPIDASGYTVHSSKYWSTYSHDIGDESAIWISADRVLLPTLWSGQKEYWLCDLDSDTYRQVTGFNADTFPKGATTPYPDYGLYTIYPAYDAANNRLLFFFPTQQNRCSVRSVQLP